MKLHARFNQSAASPMVASPSNLVAVGQKLDRLHNCEANLLERTQSRNCRRAERRSMYGVRCRCYGRFDAGQWVGFARRSHKSPTTDRWRGRHPRLRSLKRACWSDITMADSPRTGRMRRMMLPSSIDFGGHCRRNSTSAWWRVRNFPYATSGNVKQLLAGGTLHSGNTFRKN